MKKDQYLRERAGEFEKIDTLSKNLQAEDVMIRVGVFAWFG